MKLLLTLIIAILTSSTTIVCETLPVRLKDIANIIEARDNQLLGFGLVVGLRNTGDSKSTVFTDIALENLLSKMGIYAGGREFNSRNIAAVMVTATLPPFIKKGQRIPVVVSSLGDSSSLVGGTLLITPLKGSDLNTYAIAQGSVIIGGIAQASAQSRFYKNQTTVGRIPDGAIVEQEVPVTFQDQRHITIVFKESNFITLSRAVIAIKLEGYENAQAVDANTIKVPLEDLDSTDLVTAIATLEDIPIIPDSSAKVVINSRTGTVVIGEMVRLFPVALTHGNIAINISEGVGGGGGGPGAEGEGGDQVGVNVIENDPKVLMLNPSDTLSSLVNSLNEIGATPKDLISIIQALKESGALVADVEIL